MGRIYEKLKSECSNIDRIGEKFKQLNLEIEYILITMMFVVVTRVLNKIELTRMVVGSIVATMPG